MKKQSKEIWRRVGTLQKTWVSNRGRVYVESLEGYRKDGRVWRTKGGIRKLTLTPVGYFQVRIDSKLHYVHRLVCEAFHGKPKEGQECVNHKDLDKTNNSPCNLEWSTYSENNQHARDNITFPTKTGYQGRVCKLSIEAVEHIKNNAKLPEDIRLTQQSIGDLYGVTQAAVSSVLRGINWRE